MAEQFPILKLEDAALKYVLRCLKMEEILIFSLISKKTFYIIKSLKVKIHSLNVIIDSIVRVFPFFLRDKDSVFWDFVFANNAETGEPIQLLVPAKVQVRAVGRKWLHVWESMQLNLREWFQHFLALDVQNGIHLEIETDRFDRTSIETTLEGFKVQEIHLTGSVSVPSVVVDSVSIKECETGSFANQKILMQNNVCATFDQPKVRILDDLLVCSARKISCDTNSIQEKDLNRFLKAWREGSNPGLELLVVKANVNFGLEGGVMMKGIHFNEIPQRKVRKYDWNARRVCKMRSEKGVIAEIRVLERNQSRTVEVLIGKDFVY